jgi:hypothetical protein
MAEEKTNNAEFLMRLFDETDQVRLSEKDLDKELEILGIESVKIVAVGLHKISEIIEGKSRFHMPMAASNKEEISQEDFSKMLDQIHKPTDNNSSD